MTYHAQDKIDSKSVKPAVRAARVLVLLVVVGAVAGFLMYRSKIWTRVTQVLAAADEDPIRLPAQEA
jgi:hypothetical protein